MSSSNINKKEKIILNKKQIKKIIINNLDVFCDWSSSLKQNKKTLSRSKEKGLFTIGRGVLNPHTPFLLLYINSIKKSNRREKK